MEMKGVEEMQRRLEEIARQTQRDTEKALYQVGLETQRVSMERTPVDTGALRGSHETRRPERIGSDDVSVTIAVGGPAAPYGIFVHENLEARHPVGQAKFLESAMLEAKASLAERIAEKIAVFRATR